MNNPVMYVDTDGKNCAVFVSAFAIKYGLNMAGWALMAKMTAFISTVAPYLIVAVATIVVVYTAYKITQRIVINAVKKKIPNKLKTKDGRVDISKFNIKLPNNGGWKGPDGWKIVKDTAKHAGSVWKLLNKAGERIATLWGDGSVRGK